ncbi:MAG: flagellar biosynthesis protein FlhF [Armatimonadetes bacterium]|nr:flagellar biosynthesis protein FlhF [Armatimonadota bacterium]
MRIKTFEADTLQDALGLAREELGEDAVVLNTRQVKSPKMLGLRRSSRFEVTAAVDEGIENTKPNVGTSEPAPSLSNPQNSIPNAQSEIAEIKWELQRLSLIVENLLTRRGSEPVKCTEAAGAGAYDNTLSSLGIDEDVQHGTLSDLRGTGDPAMLTAALASKLEPFARPPSLDRPRVIALIGPTGVGKTTTLAKLAARYSIEQGKTVALITIDTFRIGAVEQLRTYARIMGLPLEVALSPEDVKAAVVKHRDKDVVLIDTVGRSQRSEEHLRDLKTFLDAAEGVEAHLLVSATLARETQFEVIERFALFSPVRLVVTKLDEAPNCGALVNLPLKTGLPISCVTAGQNVPQDLEFADASFLARMIVACPQVRRLEVAA